MTAAPTRLRVAFRTDASIEIGTGHVMRCLTLAAALGKRGADCVFLCRPHDGHLLDFIAGLGFRALALPQSNVTGGDVRGDDPAHATWLGTGWATDARDSLAALADHTGGGKVDWLVVDHYALEARWEQALRPACTRLMVIDDLADRPHDCDLLLDQNLGRCAADYAGLVPPAATMLLGPRYALLRPEFARLRAASLARRERPVLRKLLVTMGGVDKDNATGRVLDALATCPLPDEVEITVVMGPQAPWLSEVRAQAAAMPVPTKVLVGVRDMAELMTASDLAIGAGGATTWERCSLGLPSVQVSLAANQSGITEAVVRAKAAAKGDLSDMATTLAAVFGREGLPGRLTDMSRNAASITDGQGAGKVAQYFVERAT